MLTICVNSLWKIGWGVEYDIVTPSLPWVLLSSVAISLNNDSSTERMEADPGGGLSLPEEL